tara:strand:- start:1259 stop:2845 length:1587 start_codon:yes stop_codon:yes gene_type:complete
MDYTPKSLHFAEEGRAKLISGISKLSEAVKSTLGPSGNTVLIESQTHTSGMTVTKDGVTVAKSIDLVDPVENLAVRVMKQAAERTATNAGDGTTTAIVITEALIMSVLDQVKDNETMIDITREISDISEIVVSEIKAISKKLNKQRLLDVATVSSNNDNKLGKLIADTYTNVGGKDGIVMVDRSQTSSTYSDVIKGIRVDKGYSHPIFMNDHRRDECVFENAHVLMCDGEISNITDIDHILQPFLQSKGKKRLLIIAPVATNVLNSLAANIVQKGLKICVIQPPSFGYKQSELMSDIAISTGATFFSEKIGDDLSLVTADDLGQASKVVVSKSSSIILSGGLSDGADARIAELRVQYDETEIKSDKDFLLQRIASLSGGIGVIYVGGTTDMEQKEKFDRIDDAVCAVRAALTDGIVAGGGVTLARIALNIKGDTIASNAVREALTTPMRQIYTNAGISSGRFYENIELAENSMGLNVKTNEIGDMMEMGVIDPSKVTQEAVVNAVSVANTILSTNAIITLARSYESAG